MSIVFTISETIRLGESSISNRVCEQLDGLSQATTYTTRPRRSAEDEGFIFTSPDIFQRMIESQEFLEYTNILGNFYGTPCRCLQEARDRGNDLIIKVDERGVAQIKQKVPDAISILVLHTSSEQQASATGSTVDQLLLYRLAEAARAALQRSDKFDHIVANDRLEESASQVVGIIRTERSRRS